MNIQHGSGILLGTSCFADSGGPAASCLLLMDYSGAHTAKRLKLPPNVALVFQPAASPELNLAERVWQDVGVANI